VRQRPRVSCSYLRNGLGWVPEHGRVSWLYEAGLAKLDCMAQALEGKIDRRGTRQCASAESEKISAAGCLQLWRSLALVARCSDGSQADGTMSCRVLRRGGRANTAVWRKGAVAEPRILWGPLVTMGVAAEQRQTRTKRGMHRRWKEMDRCGASRCRRLAVKGAAMGAREGSGTGKVGEWSLERFWPRP
jgi:hypothetical protein